MYFRLGAIFNAVPIIIAYLSFASMIYFTLRMFRQKSFFDEMAIWERLIRFFREKSHEKKGRFSSVVTDVDETTSSQKEMPKADEEATIMDEDGMIGGAREDEGYLRI
jgi:hypothetical protein